MTKRMFERMTELLWNKRKEIREGMIRQEVDIFDYPDYGELPKYIANSLSPEAVDAMQDVWSYLVNLNLGFQEVPEHFKRLREFRSAYKQRLWELGEKVGR